MIEIVDPVQQGEPTVGEMPICPEDGELCGQCRRYAGCCRAHGVGSGARRVGGGNQRHVDVAVAPVEALMREAAYQVDPEEPLFELPLDPASQIASEGD